MVHVCKDRCKDYKTTYRGKPRFRYINGEKYCKQCEAWLTWEGVWCPCCGHRIRAGPKYNKANMEYVRIG